MSDYTKSTNFATKDNLTPGDPLKIVRGTEIDTEFNNIAIAIATKTDNASAAITGGSITGITDLAIADGGTGASTATAAINNLLPSQTSNANKYLQTDGTNVSWDAVSLSTSDITGTLPVANGGTGVTSSTGTGSVVLSNSPTLVTPALGTPASGVATNLTGLPLSTGVTGTLPIANGGTGQTTANAAFNALAPSQATASGKYLKSDGTNTSWDALDISTADITGTLPVANGGTGVTSSTGTGSVVLSNSPTLVTPALGTPSSGTVTNLTGTASININGTVGATTPTTGAFTTVAASSSVTLSGGTANGVTYLNGSKVLTSGSALTFDGTNLGVGNALGSTFEAANDAGRLVVGAASGNEGLTIYSGATSLGIIDFANSSAGVGTYAGFLQYNHSANALLFGTSSAEQMRLTSTGLGIGTSSPSSKLSIAASTTAANADIELGNSAGVKNYVFTGGSTNATTRWRNNLVLYTGGAQDILFETNGTERMRLDSSGNLGIGGTPGAKLDVFAASGGVVFHGSNTSDGNRGVQISVANSGVGAGTAMLTTDGGGYSLLFGINGTERARIDSSGNLLVGTTSQPSGVGSARLGVVSASADYTIGINNTNADPYGLFLKYTAASPNGNTNSFFYFADSTAARAYMQSNGGLANYSGNNTNLSDRREKTDFEPAGSYLDKICAIQVQTFKYNDQIDDEKTLGVVAQDVQAVAPELVTESNWGTKDEPKMRLSIYQTDLQYALMKCIQEQQAIIESLKARLDAANL